ncbi:MAG TPA: hypothetical protein VGD71_31070 [Kribbella sp.]|jgi:hypothetical protein
MDGRADLPRVGAVLEGVTPSLPYVVVDAAGREVEPVTRYLRDLLLGDVSSLTCRSYGHDLLRWFRLLLCTTQVEAIVPALFLDQLGTFDDGRHGQALAADVCGARAVARRRTTSAASHVAVTPSGYIRLTDRSVVANFALERPAAGYSPRP